jgi:hypothetical protein
MKSQRQVQLPFLIAILAFPLVAHSQLRVGAAKVSITPPDSYFPYPQAEAGFVDVHDPVFARAIVVDDGSAQVAIVALDFRHVPHSTDLPKTISEATGIPADHIMVSATHDHDTPRLDNPTQEGEAEPKFSEWLALVQKGAAEATRQAKAALQPARIGFGTGKAYVNVNRDEKMPDGRWNIGFNPDRPTDKTVAVIRFDNLSGEPIAIYANYAVHGTVMYQSVTKGKGWQVSGDLPGNTSRYVEEHYGKGVVAVFTSGAAGDQNPMYMSVYNQVSPGTKDEGAAGWAILDVQSRRLGEEIVRVEDGIKPGSGAIRVWGGKSMPTCPGQRIAWDKSANQYTVTALPPIGIPLTVIRIGDIAIGGVAGEPVSLIGQHFKQASPLPQTIIVNHAGPTIGYIPDDASYPLRTFEVTGSRIKEGCSEPTIVNGLVELVKKSSADRAAK